MPAPRTRFRASLFPRFCTPLLLPLLWLALGLAGAPALHAQQAAELTLEHPQGTPIPSGSPVDFIKAPVGDPAHAISRFFRVQNTGTTEISDLVVRIDDTQGSEFRISTPPASSTLSADESATFTVQFSPSAPGARTATLVVGSSSHPDLPGFSIPLTGIGAWPDIIVMDNVGTHIPQGGTFTMDSVLLDGGSRTRKIRIYNDSQVPLSGVIPSISGTHAIDFTLSTQSLTPSINAGSTSEFDVIFNPSELGLRTATLQIASTDPDQSPYIITLFGSVPPTPGLQLFGLDGKPILKTATYHLGSVALGSFLNQTLRLRNTRSTAINITGINSGGGLSDITSFILSGVQIPPGGSVDWTVRFRPTALGIRSAPFFISSDDPANMPYIITLTGSGEEPDMAVEQPADHPLQFMETQDFGSVTTTSSLDFTVKSLGQSRLSPQIAITGTHAADFTSTQAFTSPLEPGTSGTFTVHFTPKGSGLRQATLVINHDGNLTNPFQIPLKGTGNVSEISFDSHFYYARQGDAAVTVTLTRTNPVAAASIKFTTVQDVSQQVPPFQAALPGQDYTSQINTTLDFAAGQATQTATITLLPRTAVAKKNLQLLVELTDPSVGAVLGTPPSSLLQIAGQDTTKPALTLTTPAAGKVAGLSPYLVTGKASDANSIRRIETRLNGADPVPADLEQGPGSLSTTFQASIIPVPGLNTLAVTAYDLWGNATTVTRSFTYTRAYSLSLAIMDSSTGQATSTAATLAVKATPSAGLSTFGDKKPDAPVRWATAVPGTRLLITTTPKKGYAVRHWERGPGDATPADPAPPDGIIADFTMPAADTHLSVWLMPTPFNPPAGATNTLHWLLNPHSELSPTADNHAGLSGTLTPAGGFSGKLLVGGQSIPVVAQINGRGPAVFTVGSPRRTSLPFPGGGLLKIAKLDALATPHATLTFGEGDEGASSAGHWGSYSAARKLTGPLLNPGTPKGYYTLQLHPTDANRPLPADRPYPQAPGYAALSFTNLGQATFAGMLADGTAFTASAPLFEGIYNQQPAHYAPFFVQLPTPGATTKTAVLTGYLRVDTIAPGIPRVAGDLQWFRPATTSPKVPLYPQGWPSGYDLRAYGSQYHTTRILQEVYGVSYTPGQPSLILNLMDGGLTSPVEKSSLALNKNAIVKLPPADPSFTLSIAPTTGIVTGAFTPNWLNRASAKPALRGILIQDDGVTGFFLNNSTTPPANGTGTFTLFSQ